MAFQFVDDFTGPDLRRPRQGARRQDRGNGIDSRLVLAYRTVDSRADVHDVGEAQDVEIAFDVDAAEFADASQVIAAQVDEHVVFGQFLRIVQEFVFQGLVFFRRLAPRPRAGQRR